MLITSLQYRLFRGLEDAVFEPAPGVNIIFGANAQGKTSVLEAILYAATTRSHRTAADAEIARHGGREFHVVANATSRECPVTIEAHWWKGAKRFKVNGLAQSRLSDILGRVCAVFFSPEDIALVKGAASGRRLFLDMELSQLHPPYLRALQQYRQALRQRNELLRQRHCDSDMLAVWEAQLAEHGRMLMTDRCAAVSELSAIATELYAQLIEDEPLTLVYQPDVDAPDAIGETLQRTRSADIARKATGRGPHRDEMEIRIADKSARAYGSQGQQKSAALVLKLAEVELMRRRMGEYPVVLLDEAPAELDSRRARRLMNAIPGAAQAVITTAQPLQALPISSENAAIFHIERGRLEQR
ncbi:MAG TPA: DNA replication/repair protein RecF [Candidatus Hydrogenedentes bacterium]|nr:DNA replication/repair protein RecF [Candidatus Hydrogenedentota bacterium]